MAFLTRVWNIGNTTPTTACENRRRRLVFSDLFLTNLAAVPAVCHTFVQSRSDPAYSAVIPAAAVDWRCTAAKAVRCCRIDVPVKKIHRAVAFTKCREFSITSFAWLWVTAIAIIAPMISKVKTPQTIKGSGRQQLELCYNEAYRGNWENYITWAVLHITHEAFHSWSRFRLRGSCPAGR